MAKSPDKKTGKAADKTADKTAKTPPPDTNTPEGPLWVLERRTHKVISSHRFAARMGLAFLLWSAVTVVGLAIGMAGYAHFEGMSWIDAYVNAAMILSGMGPLGELKTQAGKIFAGSYAIFSGLIIVIASSFILAPVFHRVLHSFHVESGKEKD